MLPFLKDWIFNQSFEPLSFPLESIPDTYHHLWRGSYPGLLDLPDSLVPRYWLSYQETYIERDIRILAQVGSLQTFSAFISLLAALSAQEINYSQLGRELGISYKTAQAWVSIAQATFQWFNVPVFSRNPVKHISSKPKGFFSDTGFACFLQHIASPQSLAVHPMKGRLFETMVFMEILKRIQAWPSQPAIHHYRTRSGLELDLVLEIDGTLFPVEVKMKSNSATDDMQALRSFRECFPNERVYKGLIISCVEKPQILSPEITAVPWWVL